jgi:hypothetical protein
MSRIIALTADTALDAIFVPGTTYYLALFTADPGSASNAPASEVSGGTGPYARQPITFTAAASGTKVSGGTDAAQTFAGVPALASGAPYFGICSTLTGSTYMAGGLTSGLGGSIPAGASIVFASAACSLVLS